jgi:hypothetical protein
MDEGGVISVLVRKGAREDGLFVCMQLQFLSRLWWPGLASLQVWPRVVKELLPGPPWPPECEGPMAQPPRHMPAWWARAGQEAQFKIMDSCGPARGALQVNTRTQACSCMRSSHACMRRLYAQERGGGGARGETHACSRKLVLPTVAGRLSGPPRSHAGQLATWPRTCCAESTHVLVRALVELQRDARCYRMGSAPARCSRESRSVSLSQDALSGCLFLGQPQRQPGMTPIDRRGPGREEEKGWELAMLRV